MPAFSKHPCHAVFKAVMYSLFERPIANLPPEPRPVPADRSAPLMTFRLGKGKEAQRSVDENNDDIAKKLGREERKPNNLHCQRKGVVEQPYQDRNDETQELVCGKRDRNKWDDNHIVERTAEAALFSPCRVLIVGHGATFPGLCRLEVPVVERHPDVCFSPLALGRRATYPRHV